MTPHEVSNSLTRMLADAVLPDDIQPPSTAEYQNNDSTPLALLTGATGFLGRYVAKALLRDTNHQLICLVRAESTVEAQQRLDKILTSIGISTNEIATRVSVVCANLEQKHFGLATADYKTLAGTVDRIYHCAAMVNWARSYRKLRHINVLGTLAMIRFACHEHPKSLLFVSSMATCYATDREAPVDEQTDMLPHIAHMPLGYAQSKCVAESLLQQAAQRGLPVTILRPALINGDTESGVSNTEDFVAALLEGSVRLGLAMDTDWLLDFVAVDFVADVIASLPLDNTTPTNRPTILHLVADRPRYWRELILWLNLYGYPISLVPPTQWLAQAFKNREYCGDRLYNYRRFFQGLPGQTHQQAKPYVCYLQPGQQRINSSASTYQLESAGLETPTLGATLLTRYLRYFQQAGLLRKPSSRLNEHRNEIPDQQALLNILRRPAVELQPIPLNTDNGILNQIAAAYAGAAVGLRAYQVTDATANTACDIVVKTKCSDKLVEDSTVQMATLCSPKLGDLFARFRAQLGLMGAQQREAALYQLSDPLLRRYTPHCFGTHHNKESGLTTLVLEKLSEAPRMGGWHEQQMLIVMDGLAHIQSVDHGTLKPLLASGLLVQERSTSTMLEMAPLWCELARFAARQSNAAMQLLPLQEQYIDGLGAWWPQLLAQPQGLVHGDFNPRNLILRPPDDNQQAEQLSAFDWELAAIGAPQRDLTEFLCFTLNAQTRDPDIIDGLIKQHRQRYTELSKRSISATIWQQGFALALQQFIISRLPMYALMHRFRPQAFLAVLNENALWLSKHSNQIAGSYRTQNP